MLFVFRAQVVLQFGDRREQWGTGMQMDSYTYEHLNSCVIDTHMVKRKVKVKNSVVNYSEKHASLAEAFALAHTKIPEKAGEAVCVWEVLGGTGALSAALNNMGISTMYTEKDPQQYRFYRHMQQSQQTSVAKLVFREYRVPRVLTFPAKDWPWTKDAWHWFMPTDWTEQLQNPKALLLYPGLSCCSGGAVSVLTVSQWCLCADLMCKKYMVTMTLTMYFLHMAVVICRRVCASTTPCWPTARTSSW